MVSGAVIGSPSVRCVQVSVKRLLTHLHRLLERPGIQANRRSVRQSDCHPAGLSGDTRKMPWHALRTLLSCLCLKEILSTYLYSLISLSALIRNRRILQWRRGA